MTPRTCTTPLWFSGGEKGGVGKSTVAHLLIDYLRERLEYPLLVVETDPINPDVGRAFYDKKEVADVVLHPARIRAVNDWIRLMAVIKGAPDHAVLVNGAAQLFESLELGQHIIQSVGEMDRQWTTWWVMGPEIDSVDILNRYMSTVSAAQTPRSRAHRLIVVENAGRANEQHFAPWRNSNLYKTMKAAERPIVKVSHLATDVVDDIRNRQWSVAEARAELGFPERIELERWRNQAFASISRALGDG